MEMIVCNKKEYSVLKTLSSNEQFVTYLVERENVKYELVQFSLGSLYLSSLKRRKLLKRYLTYVPKIIKKDKKNSILLLEHFEEETVLDKLVKEELQPELFKMMFDFYRICRVGKIELNYLPEYYVLHNNHLYYLADDMYDANKEHNFENFGIFYWLYSPELIEYLKDKGLPVDMKRLLNKGELNKKIVLMSLLNW